MPEQYTIKVTTQAQEQLREIISYIRFALQSPGTAIKMLDTLSAHKPRRVGISKICACKIDFR